MASAVCTLTCGHCAHGELAGKVHMYIFQRHISEDFKDDGTHALFKTFLCCNWQPTDFCELVDFNMSSAFEFQTVPDAFDKSFI